MTQLTCFKANDIRGRLGSELNTNIAYRIARSFAKALRAKTVVVGHDIRPTSAELTKSVVQGLVDQGCRVLDIGLSGTEEMYCATSHFSADAGICITASHNPIDYNGMKLVRAGSAPLDINTGLSKIKELAELNSFENPELRGCVENIAPAARAAYVARVCQFVDITRLKPLKIVVNAGHGTAGPTFDAIAERLSELGAPLVFARVFHEPDGTFPQGIPNPLLPENRSMTTNAVRDANADFGVAWDGDFDRCFFFDHTGDFVDGEYVVGLLAEAFLNKNSAYPIVHDPRVVWNTQDIVSQSGGRAVQSRTGHAFIKQTMRDENAIYGGEMSAHHYFRDFFYCDSGMIPWLMIAELLSGERSLKDLVSDRKVAFPSSGEINFSIDDPGTAITNVMAEFSSKAVKIDRLDGLSVNMGDWRFNLRSSNTEPVVRLNVEAHGNADLVTYGVDRVMRALLR